MAENSVKIKIDGDNSDLQKKLSEIKNAAKEAADQAESAFKSAGNAMQDAMQGVSQKAKEAASQAESAFESAGNAMQDAGNAAKEAQQDVASAAVEAAENVEKANSKVAEQGDKIKKANDGAKKSSKEVKKAVDDVGNAADKAGDKSKEAGNKGKKAAEQVKAGLADIKAGIDMAAAVIGKIASIAEKGIDYNATMESYRTSFEVMTGSAEKAAEVVERLRKMGAETPFETTDLVQTTQLLMQYGFTADDAISKMSMLGDIAQGNREAMNSIAMGYAQMSSAGKVNLQDIKQMINGGFNPLQEISERTGESMASLYDRISKGTMSIDEITQSMVNATSEGGKFYQSMEKQSQTLSGQLATLQDNANELLGSITSGMAENLSNELLPMVNNIIGELQGAFISILAPRAGSDIPGTGRF